jgi:predicted amidohydrolase
MWSFEKTLVACVQAAPVFLDTEKTIAKACALIREAGSKGARVIALPEVYVSAYPYWNWMMDPLQGSPWFRKLYKSAILAPGPETALLGQAAKDANAFVVIGVNERSPVSSGTLYNTNLIFNSDGELIGRHRKLVPTFAEKLSWAGGDGQSLRTYDTPYGPLGTLACGENTNTLARFALLSQGELIHVANYPGFPIALNHDMHEAVKIRCGAHSFEGKVFTLLSSSAMSEEIMDMLGTTPEYRKMLSGTPNAISGVFGPQGKMITEPLIDKQGIVYAEIDPDLCIEPKQYQDIVGHYNRFDIFDLRINRRPLGPIRVVDLPQETDAGALIGDEHVQRITDMRGNGTLP